MLLCCRPFLLALVCCKSIQDLPVMTSLMTPQARGKDTAVGIVLTANTIPYSCCKRLQCLQTGLKPHANCKHCCVICKYTILSTVYKQATHLSLTASDGFVVSSSVKMHTFSLNVVQTNNVRTSWDAVWAAPEEVAKEGIMISPHLLDDHYTATLEVSCYCFYCWFCPRTAGGIIVMCCRITFKECC